MSTVTVNAIIINAEGYREGSYGAYGEHTLTAPISVENGLVDGRFPINDVAATGERTQPENYAIYKSPHATWSFAVSDDDASKLGVA